MLKLPEKKNTHQERENKVKLYGSVSHKRPPLMCVQTLTSTSGQGDSIDEENLDDNDDADDECYGSTTDNDDEHREL